MFTRHGIAVAVLVAAMAAAAAQPAPSPATATPPKPTAKPVAAAPSQPAPSTSPASPVVDAQPAAVALSVPLPRAKPKWPPSPRLKPEAPVEVASAPAPVAPAPALAAPSATQPVAATGQDALAACGNACSEILFKTVDNCLWVQSANPRPIAFSAEIGGKPVALKLEGADATKADAHAAAALKGAPAKDEPAYHTRLHDPFVSVAPGIPAYRARLGPPTACVKTRNEIQRFTATFAG